MKHTSHCRHPLRPPLRLLLLLPLLSITSALLCSSVSARPTSGQQDPSESSSQGDNGGSSSSSACQCDSLEEFRHCLENGWEKKDDQGCQARSVESWDQVLDLDIPIVDGQKQREIVVHPSLVAASSSPKAATLVTTTTASPRSVPWGIRQQQEDDEYEWKKSQNFEAVSAALEARGAESGSLEQIGAHQFGTLVNVPNGSVDDMCVYVIFQHKEAASSVLCVTRVSSPGAKHISIGFSELALSEDARLHILVRNVGEGDHIYSDFVIGCRDDARPGRFNTPAFLGDTLVLAIEFPLRDLVEAPHVQIDTIIHGSDRAPNQDCASADCQQDLSCVTDDWEEDDQDSGDGLVSAGKSVMMLIVDNIICSGFLIADPEGTRVLAVTAAHCIKPLLGTGLEEDTPSQFLALDEGWQAIFHREKPCSDSCPVNQPFDVVSGWGVLWEDFGSDVALLQALGDDAELATGFLQDIGVYYMGWEVMLPSSAEVVAIHHPSGDFKKASVQASFPSSFFTYPGFPRLGVFGWTSGSIQGGSSGGPLVSKSSKMEGYVVSGVVNAIDECLNANPCGIFDDTCKISLTWFGLFFYAWNLGLKYILSPGNPSREAMQGSHSAFGFDPNLSPPPPPPDVSSINIPKLEKPFMFKMALVNQELYPGELTPCLELRLQSTLPAVGIQVSMHPPAPKSKLIADGESGNSSNISDIAYNEFTGTFLVGNFLNLTWVIPPMLEMKPLIQLALDINEAAGATLCMDDVLVADSDGKVLPLFFESPDEFGVADDPRCLIIPSTFAFGDCFVHVSTQTPTLIELSDDHGDGYDDESGDGDSDEGHVTTMTTVLVNVAAETSVSPSDLRLGLTLYVPNFSGISSITALVTRSDPNALSALDSVKSAILFEDVAIPVEEAIFIDATFSSAFNTSVQDQYQGNILGDLKPNEDIMEIAGESTVGEWFLVIRASAVTSANFTIALSEVLSWRVEACKAQPPPSPPPPPGASEDIVPEPALVLTPTPPPPPPPPPPVLSSSHSLSWSQCKVNGTAVFGLEIHAYYLSDADTLNGSPFTHLPDLSLYSPALSLTVPAIDFESGSGIPWTLFPVPGSGDGDNNQTTPTIVTLAQSQYFAARIDGHIHISEAGVYKFLLGSDDGSKLFINDELLIDNDGLSSGPNPKAWLRIKDKWFGETGIYPIRIDYFNIGSTSSLQLSWMPPFMESVSLVRMPYIYAKCQGNSPSESEVLSTPPPLSVVDDDPTPVFHSPLSLYADWVFANTKGWKLVNLPEFTAEFENPVVILGPLSRVTPAQPNEDVASPAAVVRMKNLRKGLDSGCASPGYCFELRVFNQSCNASASSEQNGLEEEQQSAELAVSFFFMKQGVYIINSEQRVNNGLQVAQVGKVKVDTAQGWNLVNLPDAFANKSSPGAKSGLVLVSSMMTSTTEMYADLRTRFILSGDEYSGFEATIQSEANSSVVSEQSEEVAYLAVLSSAPPLDVHQSSAMMSIELMMAADDFGREKKTVAVPLFAQSIVGKVSEKVTRMNLPWTEVVGDDSNNNTQSERDGDGVKLQFKGNRSPSELYEFPSITASVSSFLGGDPVHSRVDALSSEYVDVFLEEQLCGNIDPEHIPERVSIVSIPSLEAILSLPASQLIKNEPDDQSDADGGNDASDIACSSPASLGDLNGSRVINIQDMVTLVQIILSAKDPTPCELLAGDLSESGGLDILDIIQLTGYLTGT